MINFLTCEAKAVLRLILNISYQDKKDIAHKVIEVDTNSVYKITVVDSDCGLMTLNGRIISFTMCPTREILSNVTRDTKPTVVDTISIDCSDNRESRIHKVNVCDVRNIEEISEDGFDEIIRKPSDIPTFR